MNTSDGQAAVDLGFAGLELEPGDHLCAFYRGQEERDDLLVPFVETGLVQGEKIICSIDHVSPSSRIESMRDDPVVADSIRSGQFMLTTDQDTYLDGGSFSHQRVIQLWDSTMAEAVDVEGFTFIRGVGEMTWASEDVEDVGEAVLRYETRLAELAHHPQVIMCLYDLDSFTNGAFLLDVLRTHPKVLMGNLLVRNPWYVG